MEEKERFRQLKAEAETQHFKAGMLIHETTLLVCVSKLNRYLRKKVQQTNNVLIFRP